MTPPRDERGAPAPAAEELLQALLPDLEALIDQRVEERLQEHLQAAKPPEGLWDLKQVASYLNVSPRTVENLIADGSIRPLRIRGARRFHPAAIEAFLRTAGSR